ncbi:MAG: HlyD family efflux transporter periplasmic adaptor subunit [Rikenellaceae bacterium]
MKNSVLILMVSIASAAFVSCGSKNGESDFSGNFEATEVIVSSEANGKILEFNVEEGSVLEADQYLGYIDSIQLKLQKQRLLASNGAVISRRADVAKQIAVTNQQIANFQVEKQRAQNLINANAGNKKMLDDINAQIATLEKQLTAQTSNLEKGNYSVEKESSAIEIQIAQLEDQLKKCKISSPIKGTVLAKYAERGEITSMGKPLFKIADIEKIILRAYITSGQLTQLKIGQKVKVYADFGENEQKEYQGIVTWVSDKAEFTPKTIQTKDERANLVYAVKILVKNDGFLKIGMYGEVKLGN